MHHLPCSEKVTKELKTACKVNDASVIVKYILSGWDMHQSLFDGFSIMNYAILCNAYRIVHVLCTQYTHTKNYDYNPLHRAIAIGRYNCADILASNGYRLKDIDWNMYPAYVKVYLKSVENCILSCRYSIIAFLRVRKLAGLIQYDKYLFREIAFSIWATRRREEWMVIH